MPKTTQISPPRRHRPSPVFEARVYFIAALILSYDLAYFHGSLQFAIAVSVVTFVCLYVGCAHHIHSSHTGQLLISIIVSVFVLQGALSVASHLNLG